MASTRWPPSSPPPNCSSRLILPPSTEKGSPLHSSPSPVPRHRHKHTKSLGLLSPIPSLASLTCSTPTRQSKRYPSSLQKGSQPQTPTRILSLTLPPQSPTTTAMSLEIEIQQPAPHLLSSHLISSPPKDSSTFRPSSRSEMLLRSTLLKDDMQTSPRANTHKRRHSNFSRPTHLSDDEPVESLAATLLFRTCSGSSTSCAPRIYSGDSDISSSSSKSRPSTPTRRPSQPASPTMRRPSAARSSTEGSLPSLSPHEQVLRARLERVLHAGAAEYREQTPTPKRQKRSSSSNFGWLPWREDGDEDGDDIVRTLYIALKLRLTPPQYFPNLQTQAFSTSSSQSMSSGQSAMHSSSASSKPSSSRIRAASMPHHAGNTFLRVSSPQQARGWSDGAMKTLRSGEVQEELNEEEEDRSMITPPPTPPTKRSTLSPQVPQKSLYQELSPRHVPLPMTPQSKNAGLPPNPRTPLTPSFDAKMAAERLRKIEGYVSFANVEGLGIPPEDTQDDDTSKSRRWYLF